VRLDAGLARFYGLEIAPLLTPTVLSRLAAQAAALPDAPVDDGLAPKKRPSITIGHTVRMNTGCGNLYVTINESDDGQPFELFNHMGKAGGCAASQNEAIGRLISYALRCGASVEPLVKQLKGISCHRPAWGEDGKISSCSDAIGKALEKYYVAKTARLGADAPVAAGANGGDAADAELGAAEALGRAPRVSEARDHDLPPGTDLRRHMALAMTRGNGGGRRTPDVTRVQGACPDCGSQLSFEEGCVKCHSCGFTECG
jgi:ribonucleoside-diphosphate reductase alpha chain